MSDVNLDFSVSNNSIDFTVEPNDITITPTDIQLTFFPGDVGAGGTTGQLQYNNNGFLGGIPGANYDGSNLTFQVTSTKITGGDNHYYLQTDGTGNLTWSIGTGNMQGNGTVSGANSQIQFNDGGMSFGGNAGFTFNKVNGNVDIPGNLIVVGNIYGIITTAISSNYANYAGNAFAVDGANVNGIVANSNHSVFSASATIASTVTTAAQPNISSVGALSNLSVLGTTSIFEAVENVAIIGAQTGTYNYDILDGAIQYSTANATGNLTLNFRGNSSVTANAFLSIGQSTVGTYLMQTGATAYGITNVSIDGNAQTINWAGNSVPTLYSNTTMSYTFTLIKTASSTYKVLGTGVRYG